jgi:hypothetical protein
MQAFDQAAGPGQSRPTSTQPNPSSSTRRADVKKEDDWRKPFLDFILDQLVPEDKVERERIMR